MPGYVSHTIMAREVYKRIKDKNISLDYIVTYSLGGDLCKYSKCRWDSHHVKQDLFISNMCNYIKKNNLVGDKDIVSVLYGHICHVVMDNILHPLVRKIDKECLFNKRNHMLIEGYIDSYLVGNLYNKSIYEYDNKCLFNGKMNKDIIKMIDYVYYETYGVKRVSLFYRFNIFLYSKIRFLYKIFGIRVLRKICGFDKFILDNITIDLINNKRLIKYKDYIGKECDDDMLSLYNKSISEAIVYIDKVNNKLGIE